MKKVHVRLDRVNDAFHFRSKNVWGHTVDVDDSGAYDEGHGSGTGPMELLLVAVGTCSAFDIVSILQKARQDIKSFGISVDGEKPVGTAPSLYRTIRLMYELEGELDEKKVRRAIELSLQKYCSVSRTLAPTARIEYSFTINGNEFEGGVASEPAASEQG
ncbi:MAG: OsmC family protein [Rhodothermales bacterium]|nr:OsmC family protein [Rhodothermales bacterium]